MEIEIVEQKLAAFSRKTLGATLTIFAVMENEGLTAEDIKNYVDELNKRILLENRKASNENKLRIEKMEKEREKWLQKTDKCPECKSPLMVTRVRVPKGPGNKFGYRSRWYCTGEECIYEKYTKEVVEDLYAEVMSRR